MRAIAFRARPTTNSRWSLAVSPRVQALSATRSSSSRFTEHRVRIRHVDAVPLSTQALALPPGRNKIRPPGRQPRGTSWPTRGTHRRRVRAKTDAALQTPRFTGGRSLVRSQPRPFRPAQPCGNGIVRRVGRAAGATGDGPVQSPVGPDQQVRIPAQSRSGMRSAHGRYVRAMAEGEGVAPPGTDL
jgi:hypothetical protein